MNVMLSKTQIRILEVIVRKDKKRVVDIAEELGLTSSTVSLALKELRRLGFLNGGNFTRTAFNETLKKLLLKYSYSFEFLSGANLKILMSLLDPKSSREIIEESKISRAQVFNSLKELKNRGVLFRNDGKWVLNNVVPELREFTTEFKRYLDNCYLPLPPLPNYAAFLKKDGEGALVLTPRGKRLDGVLTAFSRFSDFDVPLDSPFNYYYIPKKDLSVQEVFTHALDISDSVRERTLCTVFYLKNREFLETDDRIERVLRGEQMEGWPSLGEIGEVAELYDVRIR